VLPAGLHVLTNLERLNLRANPITQLPLDFGDMSTPHLHFRPFFLLLLSLLVQKYAY